MSMLEKYREGSGIVPHCNPPYAEVLKEYSKNMKRSRWSWPVQERLQRSFSLNLCLALLASCFDALLSPPVKRRMQSAAFGVEPKEVFTHALSLSYIHKHREPILTHTFSPDAEMRPFYLASFSTHLKKKKKTQPTWLTLEHTRPINIYLLIVPRASPMHSLQWSACSIWHHKTSRLWLSSKTAPCYSSVRLKYLSLWDVSSLYGIYSLCIALWAKINL